MAFIAESPPTQRIVPFNSRRHARGMWHVAESLVGRHSTRQCTVAGSIEPVNTRFDEGGGQLDRRRARGVLNPCARESKAPTGGFLREKLFSDHGLFSSNHTQQGATNGQDFCAFFQGCTGFGRLDAGSRAGFTSSRPPPPWKSVLQFSLFLHKRVALRNLGLLVTTD